MNDKAIILSGGGAYGAYEVGVLKALIQGKSPSTDHTPLNPSIYTGTSVGSFNAAIMCANPDESLEERVDYLGRVWRNKLTDSADRCHNGIFRFRPFSPLEPFRAACYANSPLKPFQDMASDMVALAEESVKRVNRFVSSDDSVPRRMMEMVNISSTVSIDPLRSILREVIDLNGIKKTTQKLVVVTTNIKKGEPQFFDNGQLNAEVGHNAIQASCAIPGFFPAVKIKGDFHLDGGITLNTPIKPAIQAGASELHVVYMDPDIKTIPLRRLDNTLDTLDRVIITTFASTMNRDIRLAETINLGLEFLDNPNRIADPDNADKFRDAFLSVADALNQQEGASRKRKLVIHRYHPTEELGGVIGMLNFDRDKTIDLIKRGYDDTVGHDCEKSGCIL